MESFPIFGLFDFDAAYNEWNSIKGEDTLIESDPFNGIIKKVKDRNSYAMLVPIPRNPEIEKQVIKTGTETFKSDSKVEMEHLFYSDETSSYFHKTNIVGGGEIIEISDAQKMKFATEVIPDLGVADFAVFRPMFDRMMNIITSTST